MTFEELEKIMQGRESLSTGINENGELVVIQYNKDKTISRTGSKTIDNKSILPKLIDLAIPKLTANTTKPTASSIATTGNNISVTGPFALYCLTTINVAAGAVAVATAPNTIALVKLNLSGIKK